MICAAVFLIALIVVSAKLYLVVSQTNALKTELDALNRMTVNGNDNNGENNDIDDDQDNVQMTNQPPMKMKKSNDGLAPYKSVGI